MPASKRRRLSQRYGFNVIARNAGAKAEICGIMAQIPMDSTLKPPLDIKILKYRRVCE
jgi:hypothetical protein